MGVLVAKDAAIATDVTSEHEERARGNTDVSILLPLNLTLAELNGKPEDREHT